MEKRRNIQQKEEKPLYKMKMFSNTGSKVVEGIKKFKTFDSSAKANNVNQDENQIDEMIVKIENELKELESKENEN